MYSSEYFGSIRNEGYRTTRQNDRDLISYSVDCFLVGNFAIQVPIPSRWVWTIGSPVDVYCLLADYRGTITTSTSVFRSYTHERYHINTSPYDFQTQKPLRQNLYKTE